ncbi:MAG: ABC transporter permease [Anaerolineae bacterium]
MNLRRIGVVFVKDLLFGSRSFVFVFAIIMPLVLSLILGLLFGSLFSDTSRLGIVDQGGSRTGAALLASNAIAVTPFESEDALLSALSTGGVEVGLVLPEGFDAGLQSGDVTTVDIYVWGQSPLSHRTIIGAVIADTIANESGRDMPISINPVLVGAREAMSWQQRLLPFVVLMSVVLGGLLVPAASMVDERQKRTLTALTTTPMTMSEVFIAKGVMGALLAVFCGFATLTLNGGWGPNPALLFVVLAMGGTCAAAGGVLLGSRVKDLTTMMAVIKGTGILLYAPALIMIFPEIPQWVARVFPTYYILQPVLDVSQRGAGLADIGPDLIILLLITTALIVALSRTSGRLQTQAA